MEQKNIYTTMNSRKRKTPLYLVLSLLLACGLFILFWLYTHSIILIKVGDGQLSNLSYELVSQSGGEKISIHTNEREFKKFVKKGDYEALVRSGDKSALSIVSTKSFLGTTTINAVLKSEKSRQFIGDDPAPCMYFNGTNLISYECDGSFNDANVHLPATPNTPPVTAPGEFSPSNNHLGGFINLGGKRLALVQETLDPESDRKKSILLEVDDTLHVLNTFPLAGANSDNDLKIKNYRDGFLLYSSDGAEFKYFSSIGAQAETINIDAPEENDLEGRQVSIKGDKIAVAYLESDRELEPQDGEFSDKKGRTFVQVYQNGETRSLSYDRGYYLAQLCGENYLCLVQDRVLSVFNLNKNTSTDTALFSLGNVYTVAGGTDTLLVMRYDGIYEVDIPSRSGYMHYSLENTTPCGIETSQANGYVACLLGAKNKKAALYIDPAQNNVDSIDKKVFKLLDLPYVSAVAAHTSFIYISPELGERIYDSSTNSYRPDTKIRKQAAEDINKSIDEIGIDRGAYTIVNTLP